MNSEAGDEMIVLSLWMWTSGDGGEMLDPWLLMSRSRVLASLLSREPEGVQFSPWFWHEARSD